ncbi:MAG: hypothetical protein ACM3Q2_14305 [Syntrophothermus sp.]
MDKKLYKYRVLIPFALLASLPVLLFVITFRIWGGFSTNISDWGSFGSYFWSYFSFISSAIYVFYFYKLTQSLNQIQKDATSRSLLQQKISVETELRTNSVASLKLSLDVFPKTEFSEINYKELALMKYSIEDFIETYSSLFDFSDLNGSALIDSINALKICKKNNSDSQNCLSDFYKQKQIFLKNLNNQIINAIVSQDS